MAAYMKSIHLCPFPILMHTKRNVAQQSQISSTVEPHYNEVLGTMKITLLYQVPHYIRVKKQRNITRWD